ICPSATVIEDLDPEHWKGMEEHKHIFFICRLPPLLTYLSLAVDSFPKNSFIFVGDCSYARPLKGDMSVPSPERKMENIQYIFDEMIPGYFKPRDNCLIPFNTFEKLLHCFNFDRFLIELKKLHQGNLITDFMIKGVE